MVREDMNGPDERVQEVVQQTRVDLGHRKGERRQHRAGTGESERRKEGRRMRWLKS